MMTDKKPDQEKQVTPEGAVEVDEKDLEQAAGGSLNFTRPTESLSINFTRVETETVETQDLTVKAPEVKI
jgi:hypothetical protein